MINKVQAKMFKYCAHHKGGAIANYSFVNEGR